MSGPCGVGACGGWRPDLRPAGAPRHAAALLRDRRTAVMALPCPTIPVHRSTLDVLGVGLGEQATFEFGMVSGIDGHAISGVHLRVGQVAAAGGVTPAAVALPEPPVDGSDLDTLRILRVDLYRCRHRAPNVDAGTS